MRVSNWMVTACAAALLCTPNAARAAENRDLSKAGRIADAILQATVEVSGVPGMSAAIADQGRIVWAGTAGLRDVERQLPVLPETGFRLASVSKLITATAAMRLKDQGRLDIDAPVQSLVGYLDPRWSAITTRQLAAHISGLPHYQDVDVARGGRRMSSVREAVTLFNGRNLLSAPGNRYSYSSWGYTLLSAVVEEAAGVPFLEHVASDLVAGLAIRPDTDSPDLNDAVAYEFEGGVPVRAPAHDYSYSWGGAGFRATAPALALFGDRVMSPGFLSAKARDQMWSPAKTIDGAVVAEREYQVGFGWRIVRSVDGDRVVHHAGSAVGARSALLVYPDNGFAVSLLSNARWTSSIEKTAEIIAAPFREEGALRGDPAPCPVDATAFEGTFEDSAVAGSARFRLEDGLCRGSISAAGALGAWLNSFRQKDAAALPVIALRADGTLERGALVTPAGAYEVRRGGDGSLEVHFGGDKRLRIVLR